MSFVTKDSGEREQYTSGMQRDTATGKARPDLMRSGPMFRRWERLLTRGAQKYDPDNWMLAAGDAEMQRFLESSARHFEIWFTWRRFGINIEDPDNPTQEPLAEDHCAAVFFNCNGTEYVAEKMGAGRCLASAPEPVFRCPQDGELNCCPTLPENREACAGVVRRRRRQAK